MSDKPTSDKNGPRSWLELVRLLGSEAVKKTPELVIICSMAIGGLWLTIRALESQRNYAMDILEDQRKVFTSLIETIEKNQTTRVVDYTAKWSDIATEWNATVLKATSVIEDASRVIGANTEMLRDVREELRRK